MAKESEQRTAKAAEEALQAEVQNLRDVHDSEVMNTEMERMKAEAPKNAPEEEEEEKEEKKRKEAIVNNPIFAENLQDLQGVMSELEHEQSAKEEILGGMDKLLKRILRTTKHDVGTQVDDAELFWAPKDVVRKEHMRISTDEGVGVSEKSGGRAGESLREPPATTYKEAHPYQSPTKDLTKGEAFAEMKRQDLTISDSIGLDIMGRDPRNPKEEGVVDIKQLKNIAQENIEKWNVPSFVIAFIANSLDKDEKGRVLPWGHF